MNSPASQSMRILCLLAILMGACVSAEPHPRQHRRTKRGLYYGDPSPPFLSEYQINVNLEEIQFRVSDQFLSVTLDASYLSTNWSVVHEFKVPRLLTLARSLKPAMLRVGGTGADYLLYNSTSEVDRTARVGAAPRSNSTFFSKQWNEVNQFAKNVGWNLTFGLNALLRNPWPDGNWDPRNAQELIDYTIDQHYVVNWELGNEPDLLPKDIPVSPEQLSKDFRALLALLKKKEEKSLIAGPDVASANAVYLARFVEAQMHTEPEVLAIDALTWHHFYKSSDTANFMDFFEVSLLDEFIGAATTVVNLAKENSLNREIWLGETSSTSHGGSDGLSNAYIAGLMWLDKLGLAARLGHSRVFRQDFVGANYSLLDSDLYPLPDYWLSLVYKRIVGTQVLDVEGSLTPGRYVRVYAHCASPTFYPQGSVVMLVLNLNKFDTIVTLATNELRQSARDAYWITTYPHYNITSVYSSMNLVDLRMDGDDIPYLAPVHQEPSDNITLPYLSYGFFVFKDVKAGACL